MFFEIAEKVKFAEEKLTKVALCESERLLFDVYCLKPGQAQRVHAHDQIDKIYVVLTGKPTVEIGQISKVLSPQQVGYAPAGIAHGVRNESAEDATLLVFQARTSGGK